MHLRLINGEIIAFKADSIEFYINSNILISNKWIVIDGDGSYYSFIEALEYLKNKKSIRQDDWPEDAFLFVDKDQFTFCKPIQFDFMPTWKCLNSLDWEIMK
jgi:hypothetical protein